MHGGLVKNRLSSRYQVHVTTTALLAAGDVLNAAQAHLDAVKALAAGLVGGVLHEAAGLQQRCQRVNQRLLLLQPVTTSPLSSQAKDVTNNKRLLSSFLASSLQSGNGALRHKHDCCPGTQLETNAQYA